MGNCQASDAVVIQCPGGRVERLYWPTSAAEVIKSNPGYQVALVTALCVSEEKQEAAGGGGVRVTRVRLLKPKDVLMIGQVYRLITSEEVAMAMTLRARKYGNPNSKNNAEVIRKHQQQQPENTDQATTTQERARQKSGTQMMAARGRQWRPSLQSISELGN